MTRKSHSRLGALTRRARDSAIDAVVADAKLGIVAVAIQTLSAQMGLTPKQLLVTLIGLYFPDRMLPFMRRAASELDKGPSARLIKMLAGYGYEWNEEARDFVKPG